MRMIDVGGPAAAGPRRAVSARSPRAALAVSLTILSMLTGCAVAGVDDTLGPVPDDPPPLPDLGPPPPQDMGPMVDMGVRPDSGPMDMGVPDMGSAPECGNGIVDPSELCDFNGAGAERCPRQVSECDANECLRGQAARCTAECIPVGEANPIVDICPST